MALSLDPPSQYKGGPTETASRLRLTLRGCDRGEVRQCVGVGRSRRTDRLLTDDVFISMPPMPFEYEGRDVVARFCASLFRAGRRFDLVRTRANGQPAFGAYLRARGGVSHGVGLYVLSLTGDRICAMTRFDNSVLPWFGLPRSLPN